MVIFYESKFMVRICASVFFTHNFDMYFTDDQMESLRFAFYILTVCSNIVTILTVAIFLYFTSNFHKNNKKNPLYDSAIYISTESPR